MITIHHLRTSQSERIIWLCEELAIPYELKIYERDPVTRLAPPEMKLVHPLGNAPIITDGELVLAESGAIVEYIIGKYGNGRLALPPSHPDFANYLYWFHFSNSNLMSVLGRTMVLKRLNLPDDNPIWLAMQGRLQRALKLLDDRLAIATYLAGDEFTAADVMIGFALTTMRLFYDFDLKPYPSILKYLALIGTRDAYRRAMHAGDPELVPMLS